MKLCLSNWFLSLQFSTFFWHFWDFTLSWNVELIQNNLLLFYLWIEDNCIVIYDSLQNSPNVTVKIASRWCLYWYELLWIMILEDMFLKWCQWSQSWRIWVNFLKETSQLDNSLTRFPNFKQWTEQMVMHSSQLEGCALYFSIWYVCYFWSAH